MKVNKIKIKKIWKKSQEKRKNIYNLEYEKIRKMNEKDYILNYTEIKSKYKFSESIKYLLNTIIIFILGLLGYTLYELATLFFINYTSLNAEQKEIFMVAMIILSVLILLLIVIFLIIICLYLNRIKNIDRKLRIYEEIKIQRELNSI